MKRRIAGYHQDAESHWVADLDCGHTQHVRHDPPWQVRPWVITVDGRESHLGTALECLLCDAVIAYEDARIRGVCHDGAAEIARMKPPVEGA